MDTDNTFEKSEWIGQQRSWVIPPPVVKKIAAQWFLISQELEHNLPSPYLPIAQLLEFPLPLENTAPVTTDQPAQFFSINDPDIGDEVLMRETDPTSEAADHGNGDDPYQGADVYDDCNIPLAVVSDHLLSGLIAPNFTIDAQGGITRSGGAEASDADEEELDVTQNCRGSLKNDFYALFKKLENFGRSFAKVTVTDAKMVHVQGPLSPVT
ncbi:hypothetical protein DFH08DRAFT_1045880 [Mycena albidolilacea]|uniref:Uncharacterized protein n=1 Tax=Mycena albidolilacea TaxID=1033008 RepID=A0AAD6Z8D5_9AGAR|nr:hypothetical protein DFH08DRAFT_1045880 [Mycena albidolilacea]